MPPAEPRRTCIRGSCRILPPPGLSPFVASDADADADCKCSGLKDYADSFCGSAAAAAAAGADFARLPGVRNITTMQGLPL